MSQNISIVPVKPDVGHAKGKNWPFGRENYLKNKNPSKWPTITENIQDIPSAYKIKFFINNNK